MRRRWPSLLFTCLLLAVLGVTLLAPIWVVVKSGFQDEDGRLTLEWFQEVLQDSDAVEGLWNSLGIALFTTALCLLIAIPLALLAESFNFPGKRGWLALIQVPMILPPFVGAIGLKGLLARTGGVNLLLQHLGWLAPGDYIDFLKYPFWSVVVLEALYLYPITFLNVQAALANIDPALDEAGRNLGAGAWRRFWRITAPLMRPGVFAGSTIVFIWAFTELGTPLMVNYRKVTAVQVFDDLSRTAPARETYALVVILLFASVALYLVGKLVLGRPAAGMMAKATVAAQPVRLRWGRAALVTLPFALVFFLAVLPHIAVLLGSLTSTGIIELDPGKLTGRFHADLWRDVVRTVGGSADGGTSLAAQSIVNSLQFSFWATLVDLVLGFGIAYLIVRRRSWLTWLLDGLSMLPLAVPGLVMAFGYFVLTQEPSRFAPLNWLKDWLNPVQNNQVAGISGTAMLLVIAYSVRRLPFLVRSCAAGLEQTSVALEEASINLGAGPLRTIFRVTVPLLTANFIAGGMLVFSRSMLEVSDSLILAWDKENYPMTKAIWALADDPNRGLQMASVLGVWGMVLLIGTIAIASLALGKRLGALFRV